MTASVTIHPAASALTDALAALRQAQAAVEVALGHVGADGYEPPTRHQVGQRTTGTQVLAVLASSSEPLTLPDIADAVVALRRGEDEPKRGGGTRYQEMARSSIARLIERGLVRRVEPADRRGFVRFERA